MQAILDWMAANPLIVILVVIFLYLMFTYNNLNSKKKRVEKSFSTIDIYLEKRFDEIGALLEQTLTAYELEESVHTQVSALRNSVETAKTGSISDKVKASNAISSFIGAPGIKAEAYPELQSILSIGMYTANKTSQIEDDLTAARKQYNNNATSFNTKITSFPAVLVAGMFGFKQPFELFKVTEGKKERPTMASIKNNLNQTK